MGGKGGLSLTPQYRPKFTTNQPKREQTMSATITIKSEPQSRYVTTKAGQKQVHYQNASLETTELRCNVEVEIDGPQAGYKNGSAYDWHVENDVIPGRYGPELARRYTLVEQTGKPQQKAA